MTNGETDSSESDDDDLARLREAVDCDTLKEHLYSKPSCDSVIESNGKSVENCGTVSDKEEASVEVCPEVADNPKYMSESIKAIIKANANKAKAPKFEPDAPSLRRDKQADSKPAAISELDVTPQFQKFVANKLDDLLDKNIEDIANEIDKNVDPQNDISEIKLLKRSKVVVKEVEESSIKRPRPELLAHRKGVISSEELLTCAVSSEFVKSQVEVGGWVNRFAGRVEEGIERIKKKKKKAKKKKKGASDGDKIAVSEEKLINESEGVS